MRAILRTVLCAASLHTASAQQPPPTCDQTAWTRSVAREYAGHPKAGVADLYKFSHQGIRGSEHAVSDRAGVEQWMASEVRDLAPASAINRAPLIDPLPPDGRFVRIHLRPFMAQGGRPSRLVDAFIATASANAGVAAKAQGVALSLDVAFGCAERAITAVRPMGVAAYFAERRAAGWDAVQHSAAYEQAYQPAYRVVARELIPMAIAPADRLRR